MGIVLVSGCSQPPTNQTTDQPQNTAEPLTQPSDESNPVDENPPEITQPEIKEEPKVEPKKVVPKGHFDFVNGDTWEPTAFAFGVKLHLIVAGDGKNFNVPKFLPINVRILLRNAIVWSYLIQGSAEQTCRDETGCSPENGETFEATDDWKVGSLKFIATDEEGNLLAYEEYQDGEFVTNGEEGVEVASTAPGGTIGGSGTGVG